MKIIVNETDGSVFEHDIEIRDYSDLDCENALGFIGSFLKNNCEVVISYNFGGD